MKKMLIAVLASVAVSVALPVLADDIPDMGKDMAKGQMDGPDHKSDIMKQKRHYKTMKMKKMEMVKKMAGSGASGPVEGVAGSAAP